MLRDLYELMLVIYKCIRPCFVADLSRCQTVS